MVDDRGAGSKAPRLECMVMLRTPRDCDHHRAVPGHGVQMGSSGGRGVPGCSPEALTIVT